MLFRGLVPISLVLLAITRVTSACQEADLKVSSLVRNVAFTHSASIARDLSSATYWRVFSPVRRILLGRPLPSSADRQERLTRTYLINGLFRVSRG